MAKKETYVPIQPDPELVQKLKRNLTECKRLLREYVYTVRPNDDAVWEGCITAWSAVNRAVKTIDGKLAQLPLPMQGDFVGREE